MSEPHKVESYDLQIDIREALYDADEHQIAQVANILFPDRKHRASEDFGKIDVLED